MELMDHLLVSKARKLAERAHAGQVDKAGGTSSTCGGSLKRSPLTRRRLPWRRRSRGSTTSSRTPTSPRST
jgi:hypothetical protein